MRLPKGYVLNREERRGLIQEQWYSLILRVPQDKGNGWAIPWQEIAEVEKVSFNVCSLRPHYRARLLPAGQWHTSDNLQELVTRMCVMHRMGIKDESRTAG